ncbi:hypothetical protein [Methylobacterium fujisawaense]|jgi:hypothetical protein
MRLDRYTGEEPKFRVQRRQPDGTYKEVPAFDYFVLALKDRLTPAALSAYAERARTFGDDELSQDIVRLAEEARQRADAKMPD